MEEPKSPQRSQYLLQALAADSSYTDALSMAGIYYYKTDKLAKSQEVFEKLAQVQPDYPNVFYNLALVLKSRMFYTKSIEMYRKALDKEPDNADAANNIGVIYYLMGMYDQAREAFEQALQIQPDQELARANLEKLTQKSNQPQTTSKPTGTVREYIEVGAAFYASGDYMKAAEYFEKALQLQPDNFKANNNIALTYMKIGKMDAAKQHFKRALRTDPSAIDVKENLEKLEGKPLAASPEAAPQLAPSSGTPVALCAAGKIQLARRAYAEAETSFLRALAIAPNNIDALHGLGMVYLGQGEYEKARPQFEKVLALNPSHEEARKRLQDINYILAANPASAQASPQAPISPEAEARGYFVRGNDFYRAGKYEDAAGEYRRALDLTPTNVEILNNLGTTYYTMGRYDDAKAVFKKAAVLNPENHIITNNLAALNLGKNAPQQSQMNLFAVKNEKISPASPKAAAPPAPQDIEIDLNQEVRVEAPPTPVKTALVEKEVSPFTAAGDDVVKVVKHSPAHQQETEGKEAYRVVQAAEEPETASQSQFNMGVFKESEGDLEGALLHYREAVKLEPENAIANYNLGNIYFRLGAFESAIECYVAAVKADTSFSRSYNNIGVAYYKLGKLEEAKSAWQKALEIDPTLESARTNLNKYGGRAD
jgi:tetratricopeptide (TPR) repeat protein